MGVKSIAYRLGRGGKGEMRQEKKHTRTQTPSIIYVREEVDRPAGKANKGSCIDKQEPPYYLPVPLLHPLLGPEPLEDGKAGGKVVEAKETRVDHKNDQMLVRG